MAFDVTAIPVGQQLNVATTIATAESYLYLLVLAVITARDLSVVADEICQMTQISNFLFALNDPNILALRQQKIILGLNAICTPFNSQIYPILTL